MPAADGKAEGEPEIYGRVCSTWSFPGWGKSTATPHAIRVEFGQDVRVDHVTNNGVTKEPFRPPPVWESLFVLVAGSRPGECLPSSARVSRYLLCYNAAKARGKLDMNSQPNYLTFEGKRNWKKSCSTSRRRRAKSWPSDCGSPSKAGRPSENADYAKAKEDQAFWKAASDD